MAAVTSCENTLCYKAMFCEIEPDNCFKIEQIAIESRLPLEKLRFRSSQQDIGRIECTSKYKNHIENIYVMYR